jgi:hypothetical protein
MWLAQAPTPIAYLSVSATANFIYFEGNVREFDITINSGEVGRLVSTARTALLGDGPTTGSPFLSIASKGST